MERAVDSSASNSQHLVNTIMYMTSDRSIVHMSMNEMWVWMVSNGNIAYIFDNETICLY